jgi:large subunit ribosomal protein L24
MQTFKIKRDDIVQVTRGDDKGKKGKVLKILSQQARAIVEGVNLTKKNKRRTREDQQGGIISVEAPISISCLMLFCKHCNRPRRAGFTILKDKTKSRYCKTCKELI